MRRPIPEKTPEQTEQMRIIRQAVARSMSKGWLDHMLFTISSEFRRAVFGPQPCMVILNRDSYTKFQSKDVLLSALGLQSIENKIVSGKVVRVPDRAATRDDPYFPQFAVAWEKPIDAYTCEGKTLQLEVFSGFYGVSAKFIEDPRHTGKPVMQLDALSAYHGHDFVDLDIEHNGSSPHIQRYLHGISDMVGLLLEGRGHEIDDTLENLVRDIMRVQSQLTPEEQLGEEDDENDGIIQPEFHSDGPGLR